MTDLPPYISRLGHGEASAPAPGVFTNARASFFAFDASRAAMNSLVAGLLTPAAQGRVSYSCPFDLGLLSFTDIERCTSGIENIGWVPAREVALWVPLLERREGDLLPDRLVLWAPYVFINYDIGMITGREIWGWPKTGATITMASDAPAATAHYGCDTTFFRTFDPALQGVSGTLLSVSGTKPLDVSDAPWKNGLDAASALLTDLFSGTANALIAALMLKPVLPVVVLKQFRDSQNVTRACYQALVNSPVQFTQFHGGGRLDDTFSLTVTTCASHTIIRDFLGVAPQPATTTVRIKWAAWMGFDFEALPGSAIIPPG
jgi:hypothetical protein